jgi:hypothetical protein
MFKELALFMVEISAKDRQMIDARDYHYYPEYDFEDEIIKP